jgi:hypothetical protein
VSDTPEQKRDHQRPACQPELHWMRQSWNDDRYRPCDDAERDSDEQRNEMRLVQVLRGIPQEFFRALETLLISERLHHVAKFQAKVRSGRERNVATRDTAHDDAPPVVQLLDGLAKYVPVRDDDSPLCQSRQVHVPDGDHTVLLQRLDVPLPLCGQGLDFFLRVDAEEPLQ